MLVFWRAFFSRPASAETQPQNLIVVRGTSHGPKGQCFGLGFFQFTLFALRRPPTTKLGARPENRFLPWGFVFRIPLSGFRIRLVSSYGLRFGKIDTKSLWLALNSSDSSDWLGVISYCGRWLSLDGLAYCRNSVGVCRYAQVACGNRPIRNGPLIWQPNSLVARLGISQLTIAEGQPGRLAARLRVNQPGWLPDWPKETTRICGAGPPGDLP